MNFQGIHFKSFRPIRRVNSQGNSGNIPVKDIEIKCEETNFYTDEHGRRVFYEPVFEDIHIPKVAIDSLIDNNQISQETVDILKKYTEGSEEGISMKIPTGQVETMVLPFNLGNLKYWLKFSGFLLAVVAMLSIFVKIVQM